MRSAENHLTPKTSESNESPQPESDRKKKGAWSDSGCSEGPRLVPSGREHTRQAGHCLTESAALRAVQFFVCHFSIASAQVELDLLRQKSMPS